MSYMKELVMDELEMPRGDEPEYGEPNELEAWYFAQLDRLNSLYGRPAVKRHFYWIQGALSRRRLAS